MMQTIYLDAKYKEKEKSKGKALNPVDKLRVRKNTKFPSTIWDGEEVKYRLRLSIF